MDKDALARHLFATREDSLVVIIDMQERLVPAMSQPERIIENGKRLLALARIMGLPVIFTEQEKLGPTIPQLLEDLGAASPFRRSISIAFPRSPSPQRCGKQGRRTLIVAGIEAHICVAQTALWAHSRFNVHVVSRRRILPLAGQFLGGDRANEGGRSHHHIDGNGCLRGAGEGGHG